MEHNTSLVLSYLSLRKAIGIIGASLPFVLVIGKCIIDGPGIQHSISGYYYTSMRDVFVGSLCAIAVFLMSYRGYERKDDIAGNLACVFAIGVALFPISPPAAVSNWEKWVGKIHYGFAAAFFLTLAYFCLKLFTKSDPAKLMTPSKKLRNRIYITCGYTILACMGLIAVYSLFFQNTILQKLDPAFWLESFSVISFGISWLVKGEAILKDNEI